MEIANNYKDIEKVKGKPSAFSKRGLVALALGASVLTGLAIAGDRLLRPIESDYYKAQDAIIEPYAEKARDVITRNEMAEARYNLNYSCK